MGYDFMDGTDEKLIVVEFYLSNKNLVFTCKYTKIKSIFLNLGGIISFFLIIFRYINGYFAHYRVVESIINSVFLS